MKLRINKFEVPKYIRGVTPVIRDEFSHIPVFVKTKKDIKPLKITDLLPPTPKFKIDSKKPIILDKSFEKLYIAIEKEKKEKEKVKKEFVKK